MPFGIGQWELVALAVVLTLLFGGSQLPALARRLGRTVREARETIASVDPRSELPAPRADENQPQRKDVSVRDTSQR